MIIARDRSMNGWQTGIVLFILVFANKILLLPSLLYRDADMFGFLVYIVLFLLETALLVLFFVLKYKYPHMSFKNLIVKHFGKVTMIIFSILFIIYFFGKAVLVYNVTYLFFKNLIYMENNGILYAICFLPVVNHLAVSGTRVLGRTCQLFFPVILVTMLFCVIISFFGIDTEPLLFQNSLSSVWLSAIHHISSFGDTILLFILMDKIELKQGDWKIISSLYALAVTLVMGLVIGFYLSYTFTSFMHPYAIFEVLTFIKDYGGVGRIDVISMILIMFLSYFHLSIFLKGFTVSFHNIFEKLPKQYSLITFDISFLLVIFLVIRNLERTIVYAENYLPYLSIISFILVPILTIIFLFMKKHEEGKK